jgi:glycine/D-amino acid oxidase-like deaminating enzyme
MTREVVVVGGGIVGVCLARELALKPRIAVTVLERRPDGPHGSTPLAPGFVGLYNDADVLTSLARTSAAVYAEVEAGFTRAGGLELATSDAGAAEIERRVRAARAAGLPARELDAEDLPTSVTSFVDSGRLTAAAHFADDGVADPVVLTAALRRGATAAGARFLSAQEVIAVEQRAGSTVVTTTAGNRFRADDVVLAAGVWGPSLADMVGLELPLVPVAHPYVYSGPEDRLDAGPFVRWPEHHVYARVHGDRLGIGTYDHTPVAVDQSDLRHGAGLPWASTTFDPAITRAQSLLLEEARFVPAQRVNGVFAMTPDNLPFVGPHPSMSGVWIAQAIWVTHAAGAARALARALADEEPVDGGLAVDRFTGRDAADLSESALRLYRDIYANDAS